MGRAEASTPTLRVEVACSPRAGEVQRLSLTLPAGTTVAQAIALTGWALPQDIRIAIWGRLREPAELLRDRDRVEICRPLSVDPKEARRQRFRAHREGRKA